MRRGRCPCPRASSSIGTASSATPRAIPTTPRARSPSTPWPRCASSAAAQEDDMAEDFEYVSRTRLVYKNGARHAYLGEVPEPVVYGVQGALRQYYGAPEGPPVASTLD